MPLRSRHVHMVAFALVPGLGQLFAGRWRDALMLLFVAAWLGTFLMAAEPAMTCGARLSAFLFGAPAIDGGLKRPLIVVFSAFLYGLRALSAWSALNPRQACKGESALPPTLPDPIGVDEVG